MPNYIWQRRATPTWLARREAQLQAATAQALAVIEQPARARILLQAPCANAAAARALQRDFGGTIEVLPRDWLQRFAQAQKLKPLRIGARLVVTHEAKAGAPDTLCIPAGAAFGTGEHATTAMSLRMLERLTRGRIGWRMLDAGTGSGILALAGSRFGARAIRAIDCDPRAIATARSNAQLNKIRGVNFAVADVRRGFAGKFDVITANLFSELLIEVLPKFRRALAREGVMILSGIMRAQESAVLRALRRHGFRVAEIRRRGKWIALRAS